MKDPEFQEDELIELAAHAARWGDRIFPGAAGSPEERRKRHLALGVSPEDIIANVLVEWYAPKSKLRGRYDPMKGTRLQYLRKVVKNKVVDLRRKPAGRREGRLADRVEGQFREGQRVASEQAIDVFPHADEPSPEDLVTVKHDAAVIRKELETRNEGLLLKALDSDCSTPRELEEELGMSPEETQNSRRRLRRVVKKFI